MAKLAGRAGFAANRAALGLIPLMLMCAAPASNPTAAPTPLAGGERGAPPSMSERDLYRAQILAELAIKERLLAQQTAVFQNNTQTARKLYDGLVAATAPAPKPDSPAPKPDQPAAKPEAGQEASDAPPAADPASGADAEALDVGKASLDFEALTYDANVARAEMLHTTRAIADLRQILILISQPAKNPRP